VPGEDRLSEEHRILVVEDDRSVGKVVEVSLGLAGHQVELVTDARAGETALRRNGHGLVILDVNLPGGTGLELLRLIRGELGRETPVIMLSGQKQEDNIVRALEWGANDYVTKPFSPRELVARVNRWMKAPGDVAQVR
jgi:two-component system, OmpR family, phosphate regulon response regulator PhoB